MNVGTDHYRCAKCGETKERTGAHFYFARAGWVNGYCKSCQRDDRRARWAAMTPYLRERRRRARRRGVRPA